MGKSKLCRTSEIPQGSMKGFVVSDMPILVANVGGKFYAMDSVCSHMKGYLLGGVLLGKIVSCPVHGAQFDVTSGKVVKNVDTRIKLITKKDATDLKTFKLSEEKGELFIEL